MRKKHYMTLMMAVDIGLESFSGGDRLYARTEYVTGPGKNKTGKVTVKFSSKLNKE